MGINDTDLGKELFDNRFHEPRLKSVFYSFSATQIWDLASSYSNTMELAEAIDNSDLESFGFTDDFIIEVWGIVTDAKSGRLTNRRLSEPEEDDEDMSYLMKNVTPAGKKHNRIKS